MMTVRETPLVCMSDRSVSAVASSEGGCAPGAKGKAGSCFHTWTWESMMVDFALVADADALCAAANARPCAMDAVRKRRRFTMRILSLRCDERDVHFLLHPWCDIKAP